MLLFVVILLAFAAVALLSMQFIPVLTEKVNALNTKRAEKFADKMDNMFVKVQVKKLVLFYTLSPVALGIVGFLTLHNLLGALLGIGVSLALPSFYIKNMERSRKVKFNKQLIDGLMLLSSSLKGGLSLIQALEVMIEEMPPPISQEFGIVLSENKIGIPLEESFRRLYRRMPSPELNQLITAILLARETGGNLPFIFARLVTTLRENNKVIKDIQGLTLQGRLQGVIMSGLPIVFCAFVYSTNPHFFDIMLASEQGRAWLLYALFSEIIGMFLIRKISKVDV